MSDSTPESLQHKPVLEARGIVKRFPGVLALDQVDFCIDKGKVHGLIGENGAGKSTLMHILAGVQRPDEGQIILDGQPVEFNNTREALDSRIAIVYQELSLVPHLSVAENIFLGRELLFPWGFSWGFIDSRRQAERATELLRPLDDSIDPKAKIVSLRVGQQQVVEIAKAVNAKARVLFMDEPTSALSTHEVEALFTLVTSLRREGMAIIYVSHKLDELLQICDSITVLRDGRHVDTLLAKDADHQGIVRRMVGRDLSELAPRGENSPSAEVLRVENLCLRSTAADRYRVDHATFSLRSGEVLGLFGLMGSGRTEMLETIFGVHPKMSHGDIFVNGRRRAIGSPIEAIESGIGFVPEDRQQQGLVLHMSVEQNISLTSLAEAERGFLLSKRLERAHVQQYVENLAINAPILQASVRSLSGGNQQKVVLAKVLATDPLVLLLDEPTRGIDVNAKREIYQLLHRMKGEETANPETTKQGMGILFASSDLPELLENADRILVMCEGRLTGEFSRAQATEEAIMNAALPKAASSEAPLSKTQLSKKSTHA